jgi:hypothetical protein
LTLSVPLRGSRRESPVAQFLVVRRHSRLLRFMFANRKNPFAKQTDREIRSGLIFGTVIYLSYLALTFFDSHPQSWFIWLSRVFVSLLFVYCWYESLREMRRRRKP